MSTSTPHHAYKTTKPPASPPLRGRIYLAGPYTAGATGSNIRAAVGVAHQLREGYPDLVALVPHTHWGGQAEWVALPWPQVMREALVWLEACEAGLIRFAGPGGSWASNGADVEEAWARGLGLPVRYWRASTGELVGSRKEAEQ